MQTLVEFRSDRFPAYEEEEEQVNLGLWGRRLAEFLCERLAAEGFRTGNLLAEDWGWRFDVVNPEFALWVACGHYQEYPDGYLCSIEPHQPSIRKLFRKVDTRERVAALRDALDKVLTEADGVRDKIWWTYEEFMHPKHPVQSPEGTK